MSDGLQANIYRRDFPFKGRGLAELKARISDIVPEIERRIHNNLPVRILEIGCGYGTALMELKQFYGRDVAVCGISRSVEDSEPSLLAMNAEALGFDVAVLNAISVVLKDISCGLPFPDASFDVVFSQATWMYLPDKLASLKEATRILAPGGVAKIDALSRPSENRADFRDLFQFTDGLQQLDATEVLANISGLTVLQAERGPYLRLANPTHWPELYSLIECKSAKEADASFVGVRSTYRSSERIGLKP